MKKQRIENAKLRIPEKAAYTPNKLDLECGDVVQVRPGAKANVGRCGVIIGSRYAILENSENNEGLLYTVKFSDRESSLYCGINLQLLRSGADSDI